MKLWANKKFKKKTKEKETHNVSKNTTCQTHTNYAQRKRKITYTLKKDDTVTHEEAHKIRGGCRPFVPAGRHQSGDRSNRRRLFQSKAIHQWREPVVRRCSLSPHAAVLLVAAVAALPTDTPWRSL